MINPYLAYILMGGFCYRIRGGLADNSIRRLLKKPADWEVPNSYIRSVWALYVALMVASHGYAAYAPIIFMQAFLGCCIGYLGGQFDLSKAENHTFKNYALLTFRGMLIMLPTALFMQAWLQVPALWLSVAAGALFVPCYLLGQRFYKHCKLQGPTQWGEWLLGMAIGMTL